MTSTRFILSLLALLASAALAADPASAEATAGQGKPNIVLIYSDDQGWGDVGYHGYRDILTPNIDKLAQSGTSFTQGYVCASVCGPSRCGLLTGVYQQRMGVYGNWDQGGIPASQPTVFELLKPQGYQTAAIGKWHVGAARDELLPNNRDVDFFYGFLWGAHDYYRSSTDPNVKKKGERPIMRNTEIEPPIQDSNGYLTEMFTREAVEFINRADTDKPFFVYLAYNAVHHPWDVPQPYIDRVQELDTHDERKLFAGMMLCLDDGVGAVMQALEKKGVADNTLVVFMSDNGTPRGQGIKQPRQKERGQCTMSNPGPFNGFKGDTYEGGIRVPMVMHWPGKIPAGAKYEQPVINLDLTATFAAINDVSKPGKGLPFDGVNLMPYLTGDKNGRPHETLYWRRGDDYAVRKGDWKLAFNDQGSPGGIELFNLADDPGEWKDLSGDHPEKTQSLQDLFDAWDSALPDNQAGKNPRNRNSGYAGGNRVDVAAHNAAVTPAKTPRKKTANTTDAPRPNIVLIMTDDMGRETVGAHGGLGYKTPVLDKLGAEGLTFDHCYAQPICTPSRVKLMTGKYNYRNYTGFGVLDPAEKTFGNALQDAGYETCIAGKWQLGGDHRQIKAFGWDEYCMTNGVRPVDPKTKPLWEGRERYWSNNKVVANGEYYRTEERYGPDMISEYATNFIKRDRDKPFFLYYPMILPHSPWAPTPHSKGGDKSGAAVCEVRYFKDNIEYIDHLVGRVVEALKESGQYENTIVMFTGDNGSGYPVPVTASNPHLRRVGSTAGWSNYEEILLKPGDPSPTTTKKGEKVVQEGPLTETSYGDVPGRKNRMLRDGTGVPCVMDWPKYRKAYEKMGHRHDDLIDFSDFFATIVEVAQASVDYPTDGVSFASRLRGEGTNGREFAFCHYWGAGRDPKKARDSIHDGKYKLYNNGTFFDLTNDSDELDPIDLKNAPEIAAAAHKRLAEHYENLRGFAPEVDVAPSKNWPPSARAAKGVTLDQQLDHAKARAKNKGLKFDAARATRWFHAKDLNKDGVLDEKEQKTKAPQDWNDK